MPSAEDTITQGEASRPESPSRTERAAKTRATGPRGPCWAVVETVSGGDSTPSGTWGLALAGRSWAAIQASTPRVRPENPATTTSTLTRSASPIRRSCRTSQDSPAIR